MAEAARPTGDDPLAALRACGAEGADPVRFRFLEALARRAAAQRGEARRVLDGRLTAAVAEYAARFARAQGETERALARAVARHPDAAEALQQCFAAGDFAGLRRRIDELANPPVPAPLAALTAGLAQHIAEQHADPEPAEAAAELKSLRYFRDAWSRLSVERQLAEAQAQAPENAGPLNSHLLALRALERMGEVSPDYLGRFVAYVDGLLWMERNEGSGGSARRMLGQ
ncbi:MAG: DUF2894 domain-containing protein [Rhodocyclaceae bacterium]|nr:DUF2894 domain-containing protein [Rhodocyclaceae bacterium]